MPIGKNPNGMSQLDEAQIIKRVYDEPNDQLRVTIDASVNVAGQQTLVITDTEDSIKIGDGSGHFVGVTGGGLNVNVTGITGSSIVDVQKFGGVAISTGTGASGAGIPRVTISNDSSLTNISGTISLPTGASTAALQTSGNTSLTTIATNTTLLAQGSTTSGQTGNLSMGAVTTSAPTYVTGKTNPLSLNTAGGLRVDGSGVTQPISAVSLPLPTGAATAANQAIEITNLQTINSLTPSTYDYISLGYTGSDLTTVIYKTGGSGGTTVSTLTLAYSSSVLQSVTRT